MTDRIHNSSQSLVNDIKSGLHGIHGAGEALRGGAMEALDGVFHKHDGEAKDRAIYEKGVAEMQGTETHFEHERQMHEQPASTTTSISHAHHTPTFGHHSDTGHGHGQGSHFAQAHDATTTTHSNAPALPPRDESAGAAQKAWQGI
jgi:hypothetical protein